MSSTTAAPTCALRRLDPGPFDGKDGPMPALPRGADALDHLCRVHGGRVLTWAIRLGEPDWDPERLATEALTEAIEQIRQAPDDDDEVPRWLFGHLRRVLDRRRRPRLAWWPFGRAPAPALALPPNPAAAEQLRRRALVQQTLGALDPEEREVLVLLDMDQLSLEEACRWLDRSPERVFAQRERARRKLLPAAQSIGVSRDDLTVRKVLARSTGGARR